MKNPVKNSEEIKNFIHDLRTPLSVVINEVTFLLGDKNLTEENQQALALAKKQCDKMKEMLTKFEES